MDKQERIERAKQLIKIANDLLALEEEKKKLEAAANKPVKK